MKTRIITAAVGLVVLGVVMFFFNTPVFEIVIALITLIAIHEIYTAFDLGKNEKHVYGAFVPYTFLVIFSGYPAIKVVLVPLSFLFYAVSGNLRDLAQSDPQRGKAGGDGVLQRAGAGELLCAGFH